MKQDNTDKNPQHNTGEFEMVNNYGDEPDGEFDQSFKHAPNGEPYQYQNHDWHHNVQEQHPHAPYLMHAAHDDCKFIITVLLFSYLSTVSMRRSRSKAEQYGGELTFLYMKET